MTPYAKNKLIANRRKHHHLSKNLRLKCPPAGAIVFICVGLLNLIYMLIFLPAGLQTITTYPLNLGVLVFVNASVTLILWLDNRRFGRSIAYGFILPLLFVILTGRLFI